MRWCKLLTSPFELTLDMQGIVVLVVVVLERDSRQLLRPGLLALR